MACVCVYGGRDAPATVDDKLMAQGMAKCTGCCLPCVAEGHLLCSARADWCLSQRQPPPHGRVQTRGGTLKTQTMGAADYRCGDVRLPTVFALGQHNGKRPLFHAVTQSNVKSCNAKCNQSVSNAISVHKVHCGCIAHVVGIHWWDIGKGNWEAVDTRKQKIGVHLIWMAGGAPCDPRSAATAADSTAGTPASSICGPATISTTNLWAPPHPRLPRNIEHETKKCTTKVERLRYVRTAPQNRLINTRHRLDTNCRPSTCSPPLRPQTGSPTEHRTLC